MFTFKKWFVGLSLAGILFSMNACKKTTETDTSTDKTPDNQTVVDGIFTDAHSIADEAVTTGAVTFKTGENEGTLSACAVVTRWDDTTVLPHKHYTTVDFGTSGCTGNDGRIRKGKILINHTGGYKDSTTVIHITFDGYSVNGNEIDNSSYKTVINKGRNTAGNYNWSVEVNAKVLLTTGGTVTWLSTRNREMLSGYSTPTITDDKYSITGGGSGVNAAGNSFTVSINSSKPLIKDFTCPVGKRLFVSGEMTITPSNKPARIVDFGSGNCDNLATVTVNGVTRTIIL